MDALHCTGSVRTDVMWVVSIMVSSLNKGGVGASSNDRGEGALSRRSLGFGVAKEKAKGVFIPQGGGVGGNRGGSCICCGVEGVQEVSLYRCPHRNREWTVKEKV